MKFRGQSIGNSAIKLVLLLLAISTMIAFSLLANHDPRIKHDIPLVLSQEEQQWLKEHPNMTIAFDGYFPPYSFLDENGKLVGIVIDQLNLIANKLNIEFKVSNKTLWKDLYQAGLDREIDIIATMVDRDERHKKFLFTKPYVYKSMAVIVHSDNKSINKRENLNNKTVALVTEYQYSNSVLEEFSNVTPYYVDNMVNAMIAVQTKQADAAIIYLAAGLHIQKKYQLTQIKFAAHFDRNTANESIAVRSDWPILQSILNKGLDSITGVEQALLDDMWQTKLKVPVDYSLLIQIAVLSMVFIVILIVWLSQLKYRNAQIKINQKKLLESNLALFELKQSLENIVAERTESLSQSESKYRHLVENLKDEYFFYRRNAEGRFTYVSSSIKQILGWSVDDFLTEGHEKFSDNVINIKAKELSDKNTLDGTLNNNAVQFEIELLDSDGGKNQFKVLETNNSSTDNQLGGVEGIAQNITQLNKTQAELNWLSYYDDLTQLANRRLFLIQFEQYLANAHRNNEKAVLLFLDIDRFKIINDNIGHLAGDLVLTETANRIKLALRECDIPARIGGDEFTIILPDTGHLAAEKVAQKLIDSLSQPYLILENSYILGSSIGIAIYPQDGEDATTLIKQADSAMYVAKKNRLGFAFCSSDQLTQNSRQLMVEQLLRAALEKNDFSEQFELQIHYQAKVDLASKKIIGYEALIRWQHPEINNISPLEFIPIAEETGLISEVSEWVIKKVCMQAITWHEKGFDFGKIAINISAVELLNENLAINIIQRMKKLGVQSDWIEFEVTESALIKAPEVAVKILTQLKNANLLVAIDDFGTGYSSLAYLKTLPASYIKIDRSFIMNLLESSEDQEVVRAIIAMSHALGKKVIAEGVETLQQLEFLRKEGCDIAQGYWFSKPIAVAEVERLKIS